MSRKRIDALCVRADELDGRGDSREALLEWLGEVVAYCVAAKGLATALAYEGGGSVHENSCSAALEEAAGPLLHRAVRAGSVAPDVTVGEVITLAAGIALATEHYPDPRPRRTDCSTSPSPD